MSRSPLAAYYSTHPSSARPLSFTNWLLKQMGRDDPIGFLAFDFEADPWLPSTEVKEVIQHTLSAHTPSEAAIRALQAAVWEYVSENADVADANARPATVKKAPNQ
jgi:hypothetical protein